MKLNVLRFIPRVVRILSDVITAGGKSSPGGKRITPAERREIVATALREFEGVLNEVVPSAAEGA